MWWRHDGKCYCTDSLRFGRICGTHFWNPAFLIPLVEVVKTADTSEEVIETVMAVMTRTGKKPVFCNKDSDMVGTELTYNIHNYVLQYLEDSHEPSPLLTKMKEEGKLGFKSGEGFMKWSEEEIQASKDGLNKYLIKMVYGK